MSRRTETDPDEGAGSLNNNTFKLPFADLVVASRTKPKQARQLP